MPSTRGNSQIMHPLGKLIRDRIRDKGWSMHDVARNGGPAARTVAHLADARVRWRQTPRPETLQKLARGLQLPLAQIQRAAVESIGYAVVDIAPNDSVRTVVAVMSELTEEQQRTISDMVLRLAESYQR